MEFSLFYFANDSQNTEDRYRLLLEGARFADTRGFAAVWTPERHFHPFGGGYPNASVTSAAVAAVTERVAVRAGSVVAPLHSPVRIAEEWAVVDNLSHGRVGVSFASGWHSVDFAIRPENYGSRKQVLTDTVAQVRKLWRREEVELVDGAGHPVHVQTYPPPVQPELPTWLTTTGRAESLRAAGHMGVGVLTHLLGQDLDELSQGIAEYRRCFAESRDQHRAPGAGHVVLMLHTFLGSDRGAVREVVREPFSSYIRSSIALSTRHAAPDQEEVDPEDLDFLVENSFDRYFETSGLFGTVDDVLPLVRRLETAGVNEIACLIDFVGDADVALAGLEHLDELRRAFSLPEDAA